MEKKKKFLMNIVFTVLYEINYEDMKKLGIFITNSGMEK
jgi:hypothetical protein